MKKILLLANILFLQFTYVHAQKVFMYNERGEKEYFNVNSEVKYIKLTPFVSNLYSLFSFVQKVDTVMPDILKITIKESDKERICKTISETKGVFAAEELSYIKDGTVQWCFNLYIGPKLNRVKKRIFAKCKHK